MIHFNSESITRKIESKRKPLGFMSVDVEEWFTVLNFQGVIYPQEWHKFELRAERAVTKILDIFDKNGSNATFFILGWLAERAPNIVREVHARGHEIACHGYSHTPLTKLTPDAFACDLDKALEAIARCRVPVPIGFRAPSFSITSKTIWGLDILRSRGFQYDSSIFPVGFHPDYGIPESPLDPYRLANGLIEFPISVVTVAGRRIPCSGGGYFRLFPYPVTKFLVRRASEQGRHVNFYLHPWELDPAQPRINTGSRIKNFRHYTGLAAMEEKLNRICTDVDFTSFSKYISLMDATILNLD